MHTAAESCEPHYGHQWSICHVSEYPYLKGPLDLLLLVHTLPVLYGG